MRRKLAAWLQQQLMVISLRLKAAINRAIEWELLYGHNLDKVKHLKTDNTIVRYLSEDEEARLHIALRERDKKNREGKDNGNAFFVSKVGVNGYLSCMIIALSITLRLLF